MALPVSRLIAQRGFAVLLTIIAGALGWFGAQLAWLGGSLYYVIAATLVLASGVLLWLGNRLGALIYGLMLLGTWLWALWEVGFDGWALTARVAGPTVLGLWFLTPWSYPTPRCAKQDSSSAGRKHLATVAFIALAFGSAGLALLLRDGTALALEDSGTGGGQVDGDWPVWGHDQAGQRFAPLEQIRPENVSKLEKIWEFRTGFQGGDLRAQFEATPLKIRDSLYFCTPDNDMIALDAETGKQRWRFNAHSDRKQISFMACRGLAYYRDPVASGEPCTERLITATIDARLIAVDLRDGKLCPSFGQGGVVDLKKGMGIPSPAYYYVTSAPAIIRGKIIFGGFIPDNQRLGAPSGVIRGFDAVTGQFAWAFDMGRPDDQSEPPEGKSYTPDTPNSWAPISGDEELGLVYLPTGNPTPDWYGGQRRPFDEKFGSSVVALEAETGKLRWSFQTTHHDIWDYDVPSQPTLYDMPIGGKRIPALIQPTKRGEIFVLDRRTGKPLTPVVERPVPQSDVPGERTSLSQPFSFGMPSFAGPELTEKSMWGLTPIDQAWCRLEFRKSAYKGPLTPVRIDQPTIIYPGYNGGSDWGGIAIDGKRDILIGNSLRLAIRTYLIPRAEADRRGVKAMDIAVHGDPGGLSAQAGTPYAVSIAPFLSPLEVPCQQPPWGLINAVDLKTRKLLWSKPLGTARDAGPFGIPSMLPFNMGMPHAGGAIVTKSGLTFIGASQDRYLRAMDTKTGKVLWRARLPAGGQANPMTYLSPSGRQIVVIAAGGYTLIKSKPGDYVLAYALPKGS